jgi:hypothetical protein
MFTESTAWLKDLHCWSQLLMACVWQAPLRYGRSQNLKLPRARLSRSTGDAVTLTAATARSAAKKFPENNIVAKEWRVEQQQIELQRACGTGATFLSQILGLFTGGCVRPSAENSRGWMAHNENLIGDEASAIPLQSDWRFWVRPLSQLSGSWGRVGIF